MSSPFKISELSGLGRAPLDTDDFVVNDNAVAGIPYTRTVGFGDVATEILSRVTVSGGSGAIGKPIWHVPYIHTHKGGTAEGPTYTRSFRFWADDRETDYGFQNIAQSNGHHSFTLPAGCTSALLIYSTMQGTRHSDFITQHPGWSRGLPIDIRSYGVYTQHLQDATFESGRANAQSSTIAQNLSTTMNDSTIAVVGGNYNRFANHRITKINLLHAPTGSFGMRTTMDLIKGGWNRFQGGMGRYIILPVFDVEIIKASDLIDEYGDSDSFFFNADTTSTATEDADRLDAIDDFYGPETAADLALRDGNELREDMRRTIDKINLYIDYELDQPVPDTARVAKLKGHRDEVFELQDNTGTYSEIHSALDLIVQNVTTDPEIGLKRFPFETSAGVPAVASDERKLF